MHFRGNDQKGQIYDEYDDTPGSENFTVCRRYGCATSYDSATDELSVRVILKENPLAFANARLNQPLATFIIEDFHNGILGITGVQDAPDLPTEPDAPTETPTPVSPGTPAPTATPSANATATPLVNGESKKILLPLIQKAP